MECFKKNANERIGIKADSQFIYFCIKIVLASEILKFLSKSAA